MWLLLAEYYSLHQDWAERRIWLSVCGLFFFCRLWKGKVLYIEHSGEKKGIQQAGNLRKWPHFGTLAVEKSWVFP